LQWARLHPGIGVREALLSEERQLGLEICARDVVRQDGVTGEGAFGLFRKDARRERMTMLFYFREDDDGELVCTRTHGRGIADAMGAIVTGEAKLAAQVGATMHAYSLTQSFALAAEQRWWLAKHNWGARREDRERALPPANKLQEGEGQLITGQTVLHTQ
jgi:hypothetical protein